MIYEVLLISGGLFLIIVDYSGEGKRYQWSNIVFSSQRL